MQIEAIYQDGRLEFTQPIHFKTGPVRLLVEVPAEVFAEPAGAAPQASADHRASQTLAGSNAMNMHALPSHVVARLEKRRAARAEILGRPPMSESGPAPTEQHQLRDRAFSKRDQHDGS
jgi:hypothetical protein